jgi:hypothetical protein
VICLIDIVALNFFSGKADGFFHIMDSVQESSSQTLSSSLIYYLKFMQQGFTMIR